MLSEAKHLPVGAGQLRALLAAVSTAGWKLSAIVALLAAALAPAWAGPPFLTDDPVPVDLHHWEFYLFGTGDRTRENNTVSWPAIEINNGIAKNTQLHLIIPETYVSQGGTSARGLGDSELGVKWRFVEQTGSRPDIATFPLLEIATGDQSKGLGNGRTWLKVPIWLEKDWGAWTSYGGAGYAFNPAPGQRDYPYGGLLIQRTISRSLTLGGEVFLQGATANNPPATAAGAQSSGEPVVAGARSTAIWNFGGFYNFTPNFSLLFSAGHSFQGDGNSVYYVALYRTWGPGAP